MKINILPKLFIPCFIIFILYSLFSPKIYATSLYFEEEFNKSVLGSEKWEIYQNEGEILLEEGKLKLSSSGSSFPYIVSKSEMFPAIKDFIVSIKFNYSNIICWGTG